MGEQWWHVYRVEARDGGDSVVTALSSPVAPQDLASPVYLGSLDHPPTDDERAAMGVAAVAARKVSPGAGERCVLYSDAWREADDVVVMIRSRGEFDWHVQYRFPTAQALALRDTLVRMFDV